MRSGKLVCGLLCALLMIKAVHALEEHQIAYLRWTDDHWQVWVTDSDGLDHVQLTFDAIDKTRVSWNQSRTELLVNRNDGKLARLDVRTKKQTPIQLSVEGMLDAQWSRGGQWITFSIITTNTRDNNNLWKVRVDGSDLQRVTNQPELQMTPAWGFEDTRIYYTAGTTIEKHEIWWVDLKTGSQRQITQGLGFNFDPATSSSASNEVVYSTNTKGNYDLWMFSDGDKKIKQITDLSGYEGQPTWSPTGDQIAFASIDGVRKQIFVIDKDGENLREITPDTELSRAPAWGL